MEIVIDTQTVTEAGFNEYLTRAIFTGETTNMSIETRYTDPNSLVGGIIGSEGILYLGSKQIRLDGRNRNITLTGGDIIIEENGNFIINDGGNVSINDGGDITVSDGGNLEIADGGELKMYDTNDKLVVSLAYE